MSTPKCILLLSLIAIVGLFFIFDLDRYLSLKAMQNSIEQTSEFQQQHPIWAGVIFSLSYILLAGLSLPGSGVMSFLAGALFGLLWGVVIVSFSSVSGACIAFLLSRYLFRGSVQKRFARQLTPIHSGVEKQGVQYLLSLRLVPIFPFFLINLLMGLTKISIWKFAWVSQLGMLPATVVFVNAGQALAAIEHPGDVLDTRLLFSLTLLGLLPLLCAGTVKRYLRKEDTTSRTTVMKE